MNWTPSSADDGVSRRSFLAASGAGAAVATSGCIERVQSVVDRVEDEQLSLSIATVPADADRQNVQIARRLETNLEAVGIDVSLDMRSRSELLETVLIDHEFDLYVGLHPADYDPDFLYETLHSAFANETGWQNPFGFANMYFDTLLEEQRRVDGAERKRRIGTVLQGIAQEKPFEPICLPDEQRVAVTDRFDGWEEGTLATRHGYLGLESDGVDQLNALVTDSRVSKNLNPLSATGRERETIIDLLYDSLLSERNGELEPWLAQSVEWSETAEPKADGADTDTNDTDTEADDTDPETDDADATTDDSSTESFLTATVTLRDECRFHDEEPVTARDVAFTYRFLEDTSLGRASVQSSAPRYQGHVDAIQAVSVEEDDDRLTITVTGGKEIGKRALNVPILPEHVWRELIDDRASSGEFTAPQGRWAAITTNNVPPVGSGPYRFEDRIEDEHLTLARHEEHFTLRDDVELAGPTTDEIRFDVDPGSASAIRRVVDGGADVTASMLDAYTLGAVPDSPNVRQLKAPKRTFYHVGFNVRDAPFSNPHVRRAITQLIDKETIVKEVFYGHATPTAAPVVDEWTPSSLEWDGTDPVTPFLGTDGTLNVEAAREVFETAGFRYDDNGRLLGGY